MKDKLRSFMVGRYGGDELNFMLIAAAVILLILSHFFLHSVLYILALAAVIFAFYRTLSKNFEARKRENKIFMPVYGKISPYIGLIKAKWNDKGKNKLLLCPNCKRILRVPKGKGHITLHCPCGNSFKAKS